MSASDLNWYYSFSNNHNQAVVSNDHHSINHHHHPNNNVPLEPTMANGAADKKSKAKARAKQRVNSNADDGSNYSCPFGSCSKIYSSKLGLELHIQAVHEQVRWLCPRCAKEHKFHAALRYHVKTEHPGFRLQKRKDKLSLVPMNSK